MQTDNIMYKSCAKCPYLESKTQTGPKPNRNINIYIASHSQVGPDKLNVYFHDKY